MEADEVYAMLDKAHGWLTAPPKLRQAFIEEVKPLTYGMGALLQAWTFFRAGWFKRP